jgi:hypothetical protein
MAHVIELNAKRSLADGRETMGSHRQSIHAAGRQQGSLHATGRVLMFTGVRYERLPDKPEAPDRTPRRRKSA